MKRALVTGLFLLGSAAATHGAPRLVDAPIAWYADDQRDIEEPAERDPSLAGDYVRSTFLRPTRRNLRLSTWIRELGGEKWRPAQNVNALGEVPNSSWFTNRIGVFPLPVEEVARGPGEGVGPDRAEPWTIVSAKTQGVTAGFNIRDARGELYLVKFDPPGFPGTTTGSGAIVGRLLHAAGYNVPDDNVVTFKRSDLVLSSTVTIRDAGQQKRKMTEADLDRILEQVFQVAPGEYLAIASKFLNGKPIGPFDYAGRRADDPNDRVKHENRRELRGLRLLAAWTNHFDTKQHNTLDMYVEENGRRFVKHHLIDFASTLGSGGRGASPKNGMEYGFDFWESLGRILSVGFHEDDWRRLRRPEDLEEVGYFGIEEFDPQGFKPLTPNTAFAMMNAQDGYWAAKIITAFRAEHLEAACGAAKYREPRAAPYVAEMLAERRDAIGRIWFTKVCPVDFFRVEASVVRGIDLGVERGLWPAAESIYRVRTASVDENGKPVDGWSAWQELPRPEATVASGAAFAAAQFQVDRGAGWSPTVTAYVSRASSRVVAVERESS